MEPKREGPQHNFELPSPPESLEGEDKRRETGVEAPAAPQEQAGKQAPAPALPAIPDDIPAAAPPAITVPVQDGAGAAHPVSVHPADNAERIEPVWVNKAKEIIARTHDDPYLQKDQMSKVKAEYIQKRFNKQIKTDEAPA